LSQKPTGMYRTNNKMRGYGSHCYEDLDRWRSKS